MYILAYKTNVPNAFYIIDIKFNKSKKTAYCYGNCIKISIDKII